MRKLLWFALGFALSCIVGVYFISGTVSVLLAVLAIAAALCLYIIETRYKNVVIALVVGFTIGSFWLWLYNAVYLQSAKNYDGKTLNAQIEITDYDYTAGYGVAAEGVAELDDKEFRVIVYLGDTESVCPGDVVEGSFRFRLTTDDGRDGATYHQGKGVFLLAYADGYISVRGTENPPAKYFAAELRKDIKNTLQSVFSEDTFGFAKALLLGDSSDLTYEEDAAFKTTGIRHIIAISGLHVAILLTLVYTLAGKHRVLTAVFGIPVLLLFSAVAGFTPSIVRACVMQILMILAMLVNKEYDPPTALAFAVVVILAINPMAITSVSFQLSVGCVVGMFLLSKPISNFIMKKLGDAAGRSWRARFTRWLAGSISVTLSAMVFTTPLVAWYFGVVSIVSVLTNLLTLWAVSFVFYGIMLSCGLAMIWLPLGKAVAGVISLLIRYVLFVAKTLASIPFAAVYTCSIFTVIWIVVCYVLLGVFLLRKKRRPGLLALGVVGCLLVCILTNVIAPRLDPVRVTIFDVGQGQCVLIQGNGENYLVDCGGDRPESVADTVSYYLRSQGIYRLDGMILTHYDSDHAGAVENLLTQVSVNTLYLPYIDDDTDTKETLKATYKESIQWVRKNIIWTCAAGKLSLIPGEGGADENDNSMCVLFQGENCDILITGDRSAKGEQALLERIGLPQLDLLVVGHHGAKTSTSLSLLERTRPKTAVISVGEDNRYGHPDSDVLQRLKTFGTKVMRTDEEGTIIFKGR